MRTADGVSFLLDDVQGSATITIAAGDPATATVSRNAYAPYGVTRGSDQLATDRGWLGQTEDTTTGLTYLNARYYDPVLARFISPDPIFDPSVPTTLDPYRYADDNPILFTDASGLNPSCGGMTGAQAAACYKSYANAQKANAPANVVTTALEHLNKKNPNKHYSTRDVPGAGKSKTQSVVNGGSHAKPPSVGAAAPSFFGAFGSAVVGSGGVSTMCTASGYAFNATQFAGTRATIASANMRAKSPFANPTVVSDSARVLRSYQTGSVWANWKSVGATPLVKAGGAVTAGASIVWGTYSAYDSSIEAGEAPEVARDRAVVEAQAGTSAVVTGSIASFLITDAIIGAGAGSVAPGLGTAIGFVGGLVVSGITYAIISSRGNSAINNDRYGAP